MYFLHVIVVFKCVNHLLESLQIFLICRRSFHRRYELDVGINNLVKAQIDMNKTRNLIIASLILTIGIGGAVISFGKFSLAGIGLASVVGVILNLIIPDKKETEEVNS